MNIKYQNLVQSYEEAKDIVEKAELDLFACRYQIVQNLSQDYQIYEGDIELGIHHCSKSSIEKCVYNTWEDPAKDFCIFCGHPEERK